LYNFLIGKWSAEIADKVVNKMYFVIRKATDGQYYFVLKSANNEIVATSETYRYKDSAKKTIDSIKQGINRGCLVIDMTD
jgi:uncharacterized protein